MLTECVLPKINNPGVRKHNSHNNAQGNHTKTSALNKQKNKTTTCNQSCPVFGGSELQDIPYRKSNREKKIIMK
ncbi:hypothetical protein VTN49DRAFT_3650 [Thermomyces lanuginosus]|uniref:uncharacterized protein n=1 Tax=Thermomyces lanuginosus TaxID=5541 RepID=UPI00374308F7